MVRRGGGVVRRCGEKVCCERGWWGMRRWVVRRYYERMAFSNEIECDGRVV